MSYDFVSGIKTLTLQVKHFRSMLSNNDILKKLRVAHKFTNDDIIKVLELADFKISKGALGDLFRNEDHEKFVPAGDQIVRKFLDGLIIHLRGPMPKKKD